MKTQLVVDSENAKVQFRNVFCIKDPLMQRKGSGGTHNGLKNIVHELKSEDFKRVKIGAGNDKSIDLKDYVLSKIDEVSKAEITACYDEAIQKVLANIGKDE